VVGKRGRRSLPWPEGAREGQRREGGALGGSNALAEKSRKSGVTTAATMGGGLGQRRAEEGQDERRDGRRAGIEAVCSSSECV
jgi:hypothetical protein